MESKSAREEEEEEEEDEGRQRGERGDRRTDRPVGYCCYTTTDVKVQTNYDAQKKYMILRLC